MKGKRFLFALLALALVFFSSLFLKPMDETRLKLLPRVEAHEALPPELAITTAMLGGFRGIVIDALWLRAITLKQQGQFFEMVQLYDWIGKLEPRFDAVWAFGGWDMAYNVSVELPPGEERWRWVQNGISFLRNQGLQYNPRSEALCKELSWIFLHKIGMDQDVSHLLYKRRLFLQMGKVVGDSSRKNIEALSEAPLRKEEALKDPDVRRVVEGLETFGLNTLSLDLLVGGAQTLPEEAKNFLRRLGQEDDPGLGKLIVFLMADRLRQTYRMDPQRMLDLMEKYGPLDWRTPYALAIYWGSLSQEYGTRHETDFTMNFDRVVYQSLQELVRRGQFGLSERGQLIMSPDYSYAHKMDEVFVELIEKYQNDETEIGIDSAHENFLEGMVFDMFLMGRIEESQRWLQRLRSLYPRPKRDSLDEYVKIRLVPWLMESIDSRRATSALAAIVHRHYWLKATGDEPNAALMVDLAGQVYQAYKERYETNDQPFVVPSIEEIERRVLTDVFAGRFGWPDFTIERLRKILGDKAKEYEKAPDEDEKNLAGSKPSYQ